jgi:hypothetical protein
LRATAPKRSLVAVPAAAVSARAEPVLLLEADPDLGRWLAPDHVVAARRASRVPVLLVSTGDWDPPPCQNRRRDLGFLVLDGLVARNESLRGITCTELMGPGDLIQPWTQRPDGTLLTHAVGWTTLERTRLAVLGVPFSVATDAWPALRSALIERAMRRSAWSSTQHALSHLASMDERLEVLFRHLGERWGRMTPAGVAITLPLSHATLAQLVGGKRPTVTLALKRLMAAGVVERGPGGAWLVHGESTARAEAVAAASAG